MEERGLVRSRLFFNFPAPFHIVLKSWTEKKKKSQPITAHRPKPAYSLFLHITIIGKRWSWNKKKK